MLTPPYMAGSEPALMMCIPPPLAAHYIRKRARTHAGAVWRTAARACTHLGAYAKVLASLAHDGANTHASAQAEAEQLKARAEAEEQHSLGPMLLHWEGYGGLSGGGAAGVCRRAHAAGRSAARVTAARRQVEEADAWSCIAQVPLPGRFAATCHTP
jgi:hypothetical protein